MDNVEFNRVLQEKLNQKLTWFNTVCLQNMLNEYRILHSCVRNLNDLLVKKSLVVPDPYKLDKRISDIVVPDTSPFPENENAKCLGARFSDYEVMLDFICTYYSFTIENMSLNTTKKLLEFNKVIDWKNLYANNSSSNSRALGTCLSAVKKNSPNVIISLINDSCTKAAEAIDKVNVMLNELGTFQRELYKAELRQDIFNHPDFKGEKAFSSPEDEMAEIKRLYGKVIGKRKPFYNELVAELISEDQGSNAEKNKEAVLKRLEVKNSSGENASKKKTNVPSAKKMLMDTVFSLGGITPSLQQIYDKLQNNFDILFEKKKGVLSLLSAAIKSALKIKEKERIVDVNIVDANGHSHSQKVKVQEFLTSLNQKIRIYTGIGSKGPEYKKIESSEETVILNFLNKQISECQSTFSVCNALDIYFKTNADPLIKVKLKGMTLELSTFRNSIVNVNKKRSEYVSFKEESEQMKKLGISDD